MPRIKKGVEAKKHKKNVLRFAKGYRFARKSKVRAAKDALLHAWSYSFRDRRTKKRDFRSMWQIQINAAARENGLSYSKLLGGLKKANISINRKMLAVLAENDPEVFKELANLSNK